MSQASPPGIIGLAGGRGAGKDTVASILVAQHGFRSFSFADALRDFVYSTDEGWAHALDTFGYERAKEDVVNFRQRLDDVGAAARRYFHPRVWIDALDYRVAQELHRAHENFPVVIPDVRYTNEAGYIRGQGGIILGIDRPNYSAGNEQQALEVFLSADDWIVNDGDIVDLSENVDRMTRLYSIF